MRDRDGIAISCFRLINPVSDARGKMASVQAARTSGFSWDAYARSCADAKIEGLEGGGGGESARRSVERKRKRGERRQRVARNMIAII